VAAYDRLRGHRIDLDTTRSFRTPQPLQTGEYLTGVVEMSIPPGQYMVTTIMSQDGDALGSGKRVDSLLVPPPQRGLALTDLVLGRADGQLLWRSGNLSVRLNPLNSFRRKELAELFFMADGLRDGEHYATTVSLARVDKPDKALLQLKFDDAAHGTDQAFQRSIDLSRLNSGKYVLTLSLSGSGETVQRKTELNIGD
jgi:hypothetical protein